MKLCCLLTVLITSVASGQSARQMYIIATHPASELASFCPNDNITQCLTLEDLVNVMSKVHDVWDDSEIILQAGVHIVSGLSIQNLTIHSEVGSLVVRGETDNVTIHCQQKFCFLFKECRNVNISRITFDSCTGCNHGNYTMVYNKQVGNLTLDKVQIMNKGGAGIALYMRGDSMSNLQDFYFGITNSKIFTIGTGLLIGYDDLYFGGDSKVYINSTSFNGSCLEFQSMDYMFFKFDIVLKKVTLENSNCLSVLALRGDNLMKVSMVLEDVRMSDNRSPYLIYANKSLLHMVGSNKFEGNSGVAYLTKSTLLFSYAAVNFSNNLIITSHGVPVFAKDSQIVFKSSCITFESNKGMQCGGIAAVRSQLIFRDNSTVNFIYNSGEKGGAISLSDKSVIRFMPSNHTMIKFESNEARRGGAIFVEDSGYIDTFTRKLTASVFKQTEDENGQNVDIVFLQNTAQIGGNNIYGGWIDWSVHKGGNIKYNLNITNILKPDIDGVASDPVRVCLCTDGSINCTISQHRMEIFGHAFNLSVVAVGQRLNPVIEFVEASLENNFGHSNSERRIKPDHKVQIVQKNCTVLRYILLSPNHEEIVSITPLRKEFSPKFDDSLLRQFPQYNILFKQFSVNLKIRSCPLGFTLHTTERTCVCLPSLMMLGLRCDLNKYKFVRGRRQWVGIAKHHTTATNFIIAHQNCPYDYCRTDEESLSIRLEDQDEQCAFNRTGTLCGSCRSNLSRVFGTSRCKTCSNRLVFLLAPTFFLSGLLLVIFLMLLNLTVSVGTINGLTFYANVIRAQHATFFTASTSNSFLSWFIAWLNLDQGIETCFYDGLNDYIITWLQFLFPLYIWLIAATLIVSSHYSMRISKLTGKNAVPVLATLFLISYTKVLRFVIDAISFTTITQSYPDGYKKTVWLIDGNVEFFKGKHIPLLIVTVMFLLLSLPYTFVLLTIQLIYKVSHCRVMFWVQTLKPLIDAYTGPYKPPHRYWTGLLLVARIVLLVTFSVNKENNPSTNLIATTTVSFLLLGWISSVGSIYESSLNNFLETIFLANVGITSAIVSFNLSNKTESPVAIYISTSLTFAILVLIVLYHIQRQLLLTRLGSKVMTRILTALSSREGYEQQIDEDIIERRSKGPSFTRQRSQVTSTIMQSFEKVYKVYHPDELKESLLTD